MTFDHPWGHTGEVTSIPSADIDLRRRIGRAWRQIRRGASAISVKDLFYGSQEGTLDLALADALAVVCQQGSMRMGQLAEALQITPASTTRAVSCLADKGYVQRVKAADDHRSILVSATADGQERYEVFNAKIQTGLQEILDEFSPEEQVQLAEYLERFVQSVDRYVERHTAQDS